jgi:hypothetical protein
MTAETTVEVACAPDTARERARVLIAGSGRVLEDPNGADDGSVWGIVASGAMNLVPALVWVQAKAAGPGGSRVHVRATGQGGSDQAKDRGQGRRSNSRGDLAEFVDGLKLDAARDLLEAYHRLG